MGKLRIGGALKTMVKGKNIDDVEASTIKYLTYTEKFSQINFITDQEIISVYLLQSKLIRKKPKNVKQTNLEEFLKEKSVETEDQEPTASTSAAPGVTPGKPVTPFNM